MDPQLIAPHVAEIIDSLADETQFARLAAVGILQKLHAFERLLDGSPELQGRVTLVMVCVPAAKEMTVYRPLQQQIEQAVGRINGRLGFVVRRDDGK